MTQQRLPTVNSDDGDWGNILNQFLSKEHHNTGTDNSLNGGHEKVTLTAGSAVAGTAPLKFNTGPLLGTPEAGTVEFYNSRFYVTNTTNVTTQKVIAAYDDSSGANGDIYYRDANANFVKLTIGADKTVLTSNGTTPGWATPGPTFQQVLAINSMRI